MKIEQKVEIFDEKLIKLTKKTKKFFLSTSLSSALFYFAGGNNLHEKENIDVMHSLLMNFKA